MKRNYVLFGALSLWIALCFAAGCGSGTAVTGGTADGVKFRFVAFGDLQIGTLQAGNLSCTNIPQLRQTVIDINNLNPKPQFAFLIGDIVLNMFKDNGEVLKVQLNAWQDVYNGLPVTNKSQLLPIAGNHELTYEDFALNAQAPNPGAINEWVSWFSANGYAFAAGNGPTPAPPNLDDLARDESKLTYSFNRGDIHFIIINTDTLNTNTDPGTGLVLAGWIPINWIEQDMANAQQDPTISTIIVVGHRPVEAPAYSTEPGSTILNTVQFPLADRLSQAMSQNGKVKLYLACHCHSFDARQLNNGAGVWQVIAGNGGAPLQEGWNPEWGACFGYSVIDVYQSGKIVLDSFGRDLPPAPQKFYEDLPVPPKPATLRQELVIYAP